MDMARDHLEGLLEDNIEMKGQLGGTQLGVEREREMVRWWLGISDSRCCRP